MIFIPKACCRKAAPGFWLFALTLACTGPAYAQRNIGSTVTIERDVSGAIEGRIRTLGVGDGIFANETIRTANSSAAQLQFLDQTKISMGPSAAVVLDRFVYNPDRTARQATVEVTTGAARWVSGSLSLPGAHQVRTPHAIIGIRGTIFDLLVEPRRTIVTLREGLIVVCPIAAQQSCVTVSPGQTVTVTPTAVQGPSPAGPSPTRFADLCLAPGDRASCQFTTTAQLDAVPRWAGAYFGVHGGGIRDRGGVTTRGTAAVNDSINLGNVARFLDAGSEGAIFGGQFGYSWQVGSWVVGLEADASVLSARGRATVTRDAVDFGGVPIGVLVTTSAEHNIDFLSTFRGRAGMAFGDLLVYGTAGLAVGHIELDGSIRPNPALNPTYVGSRSLFMAGYAVGGGIELALGDQFSIRGEYLHYDLGDQDVVLRETTGLAPGEFATMRFQTRGDIVRVGLNRRF
jgi:opacity protein-like surface antigen